MLEVPQDGLQDDEEIPDWAKTPSKTVIGVQSQLAPMTSSSCPSQQNSCFSESKLMKSDVPLPSAPSFHLPAALPHPVPSPKPEVIHKKYLPPMSTPMKTVKVQVDPAVRTDSASLHLVVQCAMTVGGCIDRLVQILAVDRRRTSLSDPATKASLSIWNPVPDEVLVVDDWAVLESLYHMECLCQ